jgi:hypothetical protein
MAVPEPGAWTLLAMGLMLVLRSRRGRPQCVYEDGEERQQKRRRLWNGAGRHGSRADLSLPIKEISAINVAVAIGVALRAGCSG